ncbi:hypothetical protein LR002_03055 [Candidatus Gracilibacteria bacterium]|nr:hypothetical protein [Candidatus Gracilibacteria bacterium]
MSIHKEIIHDSWKITKEYKSKLFKYGFVPAVFVSILGIIWISYQIIAFKNSSYVPGEFSFGFQDIAIISWGWIKMHALASFFIGLFLIVSFLMYIILPPICEGAIIHYINQNKNGKPMKGGLGAGLGNFYKMFELSAMLAPVHLFTLLSEGSFFIRNLGENILGILIPFLVFMFILSIIVNFFFVFASQFLIIEKKSVIGSISASSGLIMRNLKEVVFLWWVVLLIIIRIFVNIFIILLIPFLIFLILSFFANTNFFSFGIAFGGVVSVFLIWVSAYLLGGFNVFMTTFWTIAYFKFKEIDKGNF